MAKSLAQIQAQIAKLQKEAEALRARQVAAIVAQVKTLMAEHGLTASDLGLDGAPAKASKAGAESKRPASKRTNQGVTKRPAAKARRAAVRAKAAKPAKPAKPSRAAKAGKAAGVIKYSDGAGNAWTGRGKRPNWFLSALAAGKKAEDLLVAATA